GWSKVSLGKMGKINSFLKESQCLVGSGAGDDLERMAIKAFTFPDGTFIPKGQQLSCLLGVCTLTRTLRQRTRLDTFRFSNVRDEGGEGSKHSSFRLNTCHLGMVNKPGTNYP
ncbi:hypothetical protein HD554DRAFT_2030582, partial [Boletus coccyginus]